MALLAIGIAASCVALYEQRVARMQLTGWGWEESETIIKSPLYYAAHGLQLALMTGAGVLALVRAWRRIPSRHLVALFSFQGAGVLMSLRGLSLDDFMSTRVVDATGPFVTIISLVALTTIDRTEARAVSWLLVALSLVFTGVVAFEMLELRSVVRLEAVAALQGYLNVLYWLAAWTLLGVGGRRPWLRGIRWMPLLAYGVGSVLVQTRLNLVMAALLILANVYLQRRARGSTPTGLLVLAVLLAFGILVGPSLVRETALQDLFVEALGELGDRATEDTRTSQLVAFFADVSPWELILGRGSRSTWNWPGMSARWAGSTDVGYLSLLFIGGLPLLVTYALLHIVPAWRILRLPSVTPQLAPATLVALWGVRMLSSSFPTFTIEYYVVLFALGYCWRPFVRERGSPQQAP